MSHRRGKKRPIPQIIRVLSRDRQHMTLLKDVVTPFADYHIGNTVAGNSSSISSPCLGVLSLPWTSIQYLVKPASFMSCSGELTYVLTSSIFFIGYRSNRLTKTAYPRRLLDIPNDVRGGIFDTRVTRAPIGTSTRFADQTAHVDWRTPSPGCTDTAREETAGRSGENQ